VVPEAPLLGVVGVVRVTVLVFFWVVTPPGFTVPAAADKMVAAQEKGGKR
jgi:hypothetical protein